MLSQGCVSGNFFLMFTFTPRSSISQQFIFLLIMHIKYFLKKFLTKDLLCKFKCIRNNKTTLNLHMSNQFWLVKRCDKTNYKHLLQLLSKGFCLFSLLWFFQNLIIVLFFLLFSSKEDFIQILKLGISLNCLKFSLGIF